MKKIISEIFKKHFLFFILIPIVITSQLYLLSPHLKYGFTDTDDGYRYIFHIKEQSSLNIFQFFYELYRRSHVYLHQYLYIGVLNHFFGENIIPYHHLAHLFKILATLSLYPLFFIISGSSLVAFISVIIYSFSYSTIGTLDNVVQGADYIAVIFLSVFLSIYFSLIKKGGEYNKFSTLLLALVFLLATLTFSTERTYPLVLLILITEIILLVKNHSVSNIKQIVKRFCIFMSPALIVLAIQPIVITEFIGPSSQDIVRQFRAGSTELSLIPFTSFTSTFLPSRYWSLPILIILITIVGPLLALFISKKPYKFLLIIYSIWIPGSILTFLLAKNIEYFKTFAIMASAAFYILGIAVSSVSEWFASKKQLLLGLFLGPFYSFLFILSTWLGTHERTGVFVDVHRYLTFAAIFSSLFWASLVVILHNRLGESGVLKTLYIIPIMILLPLLFIASKEIKIYFSDKLLIGYGFEDKKYMRQQLYPYYQNVSVNNPRLIYVDMDFDKIHSTFYGETINGGSSVWPLNLPSINYNEELVPVLVKDYNLLKSSVTEKDGKKGIYFESVLGISWLNKKIFYQSKDFYAVRLINRHAVDITNQVKQELGLE